MNQEEAQELIAEIKEIYNEDWKPVQCESRMTTELTCRKIEKIINRFAMKPPATGYYSEAQNPNGYNAYHIHLNFNKSPGVAYLFAEKDDGFGYTYYFDKEQLKQLRDNIQKMLDYLGENNGGN